MYVNRLDLKEKSRTDLCPKPTQNVWKISTKFVEIIHSSYFLKHFDQFSAETPEKLCQTM